MSVSTLTDRRLDAAPPRLSRERRALPDGALTTVHVARFDRDAFALSVVALDPPATLAEWCATAGAPHERCVESHCGAHLPSTQVWPQPQLGEEDGPAVPVS